MVTKDKKIRFSGHALEALVFRGGSEEEVIKAIRTSKWQSAQYGRLECELESSFNNEWNNQYYEKKKVRPIFVDESDEIIVVTVYVYFY